MRGPGRAIAWWQNGCGGRRDGWTWGDLAETALPIAVLVGCGLVAAAVIVAVFLVAPLLVIGSAVGLGLLGAFAAFVWAMERLDG